MAKKSDETVDIDREELDADHAELRVYELGFHIDPEVSTDEAKKTFEGIRAAIEKVGTVVSVGEPTKISLAYTVSRSETGGRRDFDASYFSWIAYEANGIGHEAVTAAAKEESRIFRFIDLRTTKEQAQHFAEMQELLARTPEAEHSGEEVSDAEIDAALKEVSA